MHEDIKRELRRVGGDIRSPQFAYPLHRMWKQTEADPNIDHRRVPNLIVYLERHGTRLPVRVDQRDPAVMEQWWPGDIVVYGSSPESANHIAIVSDRMARSGVPYVIDAYPTPGYVSETYLVDTWKIVGHYRMAR